MNLLAIDTTGASEIITLHTGGKNYVKEYVGTKHSEGLLLHIDKVLNKAKLTLNDIDVFGVVSGPGSFTGIRIGLATIKAFAYALGKPCVCASRFDILSSCYKGWALIRCTKTSVYYAHIEGSISYGVVDNADICSVISKGSPIAVLDDEQLPGLDAYNVITTFGYKDMILPYMLNSVDLGNTCTSNELRPMYIQVSQAERNIK